MAPTVNVDFTNLGSEIIAINYKNPSGRPQETIYVEPNEILRKPMEINFSFFFKFVRGRFEKTATYVPQAAC